MRPQFCMEKMEFPNYTNYGALFGSHNIETPLDRLDDDINMFEKLKANALKQLHEIKYENSNLSSKAEKLLNRTELLNCLMKTKNFSRSFTKLTGSGDAGISIPKLPTSSTSQRNLRNDDSFEMENFLQMTEQLQDLQKNCSEHAKKFTDLIEMFQNMVSYDSKIKEEISAMQFHLQHVGENENNSSELKKELKYTQKLVDELTVQNQTLVSSKNEVEEELWSAKIALVDLKSEQEAKGYFSPLKRLEQMKKAFDENESIIETQKQQIAEKNNLIQKYHHCFEKTFEVLEKKSKMELDSCKSHKLIEKLQEENSELTLQKVEADVETSKLRSELMRITEENELLRKSLVTYVRQVEKVEIMNHTLINKLPPQNEEFDKEMLELFHNPAYDRPEHRNSRMQNCMGAGDASQDPHFGPVQMNMENERSSFEFKHQNDHDEQLLNKKQLSELVAELSNMATTAKNIGNATEKIITAFTHTANKKMSEINLNFLDSDSD